LKTAPRPKPSAELSGLRARLAEADETLRAIRTGEVDAVVTFGKAGLQVFTLQGADHGYRALIESMNEGALTLTKNKTILYANSYFARLVKHPLQKVIGGSFRRFLSPKDRASLQAVIIRADRAGAKVQVQLKAGDGALIAVQISLRPLAANGAKSATIGMVVTDMTEARRSEEMLRALTHRVVQAQEAERWRVRHAVAGDHKAGAPDQHENSGHRPDQGALAVSGPWHESPAGPSAGNRPSTRWSAPRRSATARCPTAVCRRG